MRIAVSQPGAKFATLRKTDCAIIVVALTCGSKLGSESTPIFLELLELPGRGDSEMPV